MMINSSSSNHKSSTSPDLASTTGVRRRHEPLSYDNLFLTFLVVSSQIILVPGVTAQSAPPGPGPDYPYAKFSPSMAVIIVVLIAALFFMGFFSIYIRHCSDTSGAGNSVRQALSMRSRRAAASRGLDPSVIESFPTFSYSDVKGHKIGKGALECAVCLNEFEADETLRLIPKCDHVFHPECIDAWLESHVTCPVCRANLTPQPGDDEPATISVPPLPDTDLTHQQTPDLPNDVTNNPQPNDEVSIRVTFEDDHESQESARPEVVNRTSSVNNSVNRPPRSWSVKGVFGRFRSHSTGHSLGQTLVQPGENLDRFTLRLPEEVRKEVMNRALLNRTASTAMGLRREASSRRGYRGEGSSRGGRSYMRMDRSDRAVKSDRWVFAPQFLSRAWSIRSQKVVADSGEGSTSKGARAAVKLPSFKCLEPKSADETGLVSADSARPPPPV